MPSKAQWINATGTPDLLKSDSRMVVILTLPAQFRLGGRWIGNRKHEACGGRLMKIFDEVAPLMT